MNPELKRLYEAVIGPSRTDYYLDYFERAEARGYSPISWHWPAFFLGIFWFLFRKQYAWTMIVLACNLGISVVTYAVMAMGLPELANPIYFVFTAAFQGLYIPLHANGIYHRWAKGQLALASAGHPAQAERQVEILNQVGGINRHLPLIVILAMILVMVATGPTITTQ